MSPPHPLFLDVAWSDYCASKPKRAPYDLDKWRKAAREHFEAVTQAHYAQWVDDTVTLFATGYPRLEGEPPELRLIQTRPFRPSLLDRLDGFPPTDQIGYPLTFYNHALCRRLCQLLAAAGHYATAAEAYLYMTYSDRYFARAEWILWALTDLLYVTPTLPPDFDQLTLDYFADASLRPIAPIRSSAAHQPAQLTIF